MKYKILIIYTLEDYILNVKNILHNEDYDIYKSKDIDEEIKNILHNGYRLLLMDIESQEFDPLRLINSVRTKSAIPIIILTKNKDKYRRIQALEAGADTIIDIECDKHEINAYIKSIMRRSYELCGNKNNSIKFGDIEIDVGTRKVMVAGKLINITSREYDILYMLINNRGRVYDRETLLELIWGYNYYGDSRTVDVHVRRLREKIEKNPENPQHILTKWGVGYYYKE